MSTITIRIRGFTAAQTITMLTPPSIKLIDLKLQIVDSLLLDDKNPNHFDILLGFPPVLLDEDNDFIVILSRGDSIRLQKKLMAGIQAYSDKKYPTTNRASKTSNNNIHTLNSSSVSPKVQKNQSIRRKATGSNEEDIADHLINAVNGGSSSRDKTLRKVFRSAIELQYATTKAVDRLGSVYSGGYTITENNSVLGTGNNTTITVAFRLGGGGRSYHEEVFLSISFN